MRLQKIKCIVWAVIIVMMLTSFSFSAVAVEITPEIMPMASYGKPVISEPEQYQEYICGRSITIKWSKPTGTVSHYLVSVRHIRRVDVEIDELIANKEYTTSKSYTIKAADLMNNSLYRVCICAVYTDGTEKYSSNIYFYTSVHNTNISHPVSFKIWNGFGDATKDAIYYSARAWNNALNYNSTELVNTYPFSQGQSSNNIVRNDGINSVTGKSEGIGDHYAITYTRVNSAGNPVEIDINLNKSYPWANSAQPGKYDVQSTMTHEMGHAVGVTDKYEDFADGWTMKSGAILNDISRRSLHAQDIANLNQLYTVS